MSVTANLFPVSVEDKKIEKDEVSELTFSDLDLKEKHIEDFIRRNVDVLFLDEDESLLVVGQQVRNSGGGISDLVALDATGNIVLIELKRDKTDAGNRKEPFEFQAIRYAAGYAKIEDRDSLVESLFVPYLRKHEDEYKIGERTHEEFARREINDFLSQNEVDTFNQKQRIILVASGFDEQTLSACAWLAKSDVDIRCLKISPLEFKEQRFFAVEQTIPPPELNEYLVEVDSGGVATYSDSRKTRSRKSLPRVPQLMEWDILKKGDKIEIRGYDNSEAEVLDDRHVEYEDEKMRFNDWGTKITNWSAINIYEWTVLKKNGCTLDKLRQEKLDELRQKRTNQ